MKYGVIDIGSNTIRLAIYKITGKKLEYMLNEKYFVQLISYVNNGIMAEEGVQYMIHVLNSLKGLASHHDLHELLCFATAPFRAVKDPQVLIDKIHKDTGLEAELLTGIEEALLGVAGAQYLSNVKDGLFIDLGGGSMEASILKDGAVWRSGSVNFGSVTLTNKYVSAIFPNKKESASIRRYADSHLKEISWLGDAAGMNLYCMGGTARSMGQVHEAVHKADVPLDKYSFPGSEIKPLYKYLQKGGIESVRLLSKICPGRLFTFVPGVMLLSKVAKKAGIADVHFSLYGVREGYLLNRVMTKSAKGQGG